jgi:hypothetical protein
MAQRSIHLRGKITNESGQAIAAVTVGTRTQSVLSNEKGEYSIQIPVLNDTVSLWFSAFNYETQRKQFRFSHGAEQTFSPVMQHTVTAIPGVVVRNRQAQEDNINIVSGERTINLPGLSLSGAEGAIKTMPGVSSKSEMSSQYSVRGGSYDENLVFVNDIPAMRPNIATSDRQEGLSIINPYMVGSLEFSSGGFDAQYGDKLSSVLNVQYKEVERNQIQLAASLMDVNLTAQSVNDSAGLSALVGVRYKNTSLMLGTLDEQGEYKPEFFDAQALLSWKISPKVRLSYWFYAASNKYSFLPKFRQTDFGGLGNTYRMNIYFEGNEQYIYQNMGNALSVHYKVAEGTFLNAHVLYYRAVEYEKYDILGEYWLSELEVDENGNKHTSNDSTKNLAVGLFLNHARNHLYTNTLHTSHDGKHIFPFFTLTWGASAAFNHFDAQYNEWTFRDSSGYAMPFNDTLISLRNGKNANFTHTLQAGTAYISGSKRIVFEHSANRSTLRLNAGLRLYYDDYSQQVLFNPRLRVVLRPHYAGNTSFSFATGVYYQPVHIKEMIAPDGEIFYHLKPQKSIHYVAGMSQNLQLWERPFVLQTELYFKQLRNIIPYTIQNVNTVYHPELLANGHTVGVDAKLNGEFVQGVESWVSLSILQSRQHLVTHPQSEIRSPNDQRVNLGLYFQDYLPGMDFIKMNLTYLFGTNIPTAAPNAAFEQFDRHKISMYNRVDAGLLWVVFDEKHRHKTIKNLSAGLEVFNLLGNYNKISYFWVEDVNGNFYAVPNYLTSRRLNVKFLITL